MAELIPHEDKRKSISQSTCLLRGGGWFEDKWKFKNQSTYLISLVLLPSPVSPHLHLQIVSRACASPWLSVCCCQTVLDPQVNVVRDGLILSHGSCRLRRAGQIPPGCLPWSNVFLRECIGIVYHTGHHYTYHLCHGWDLVWNDRSYFRSFGVWSDVGFGAQM